MASRCPAVGSGTQGVRPGTLPPADWARESGAPFPRLTLHRFTFLGQDEHDGLLFLISNFSCAAESHVTPNFTFSTEVSLTSQRRGLLAKWDSHAEN